MKNRPVPLPLPEPGAKFEPGDFDEVLQHIPETCVLIGGQAVAWWAKKYNVATLHGLQVDAASKDIDFWGRHADLFRLADWLKKPPYLPNKRELTFLIGALQIMAAGKRTALELLHRVPGLDTERPRSVALLEAMTRSGKEVLVLSPVSLVLCKLYNLRHFSQKDRHDLLHLELSLQASRAFISDLAPRETKFTTWNCNRLIRAQKEGPNQRLEREHGFNILSGIPIESIRDVARRKDLAPEDRDRLQNFVELQWPRVAREAGYSTESARDL